MFKITSDQISGTRTTESLDPNINVGKQLLIELGGDRQKFDKFVDTVRPLIDEGPIPNYPFKDDWYAMSLKQLLIDAIEEGSDAISVSSSAPIKARYTDEYSKFYETLYDQKRPSAMKKLTNNSGGKFERGQLDGIDTFGDSYSRTMEKLERGTPLSSTGVAIRDGVERGILNTNIIRITPEMKAKILEEGLPSFAFGGPVFKPFSIDNIDIFNP